MSDYKALYRKWRPFDFDDVCGQKSITDILKYEVANNKISHAYLFCGSRGTGKTSCAKILAKAVNCLNPQNGNPCNECEACRSIEQGIATDVIEMDAASNNGVDNVRTLKDEITFTPAILKYRVYIIDEVHMMSGAAFNALLKTLEEPPSYVVFILATTEYNKLPTTIVSRCQRFDFKRMSSAVIMERLAKISKSEGIELGDDGARLIARAARGGMRDAVSLLELCAGSRTHIDAVLVSETLGAGDRSIAYKLIDAIGRTDYDTVYTVIRDVVMGSGDISVFWQELIDSYRDMMVVKNTENAKLYLDLTDVEYETLKRMSEMFSMSAFSYHTSILEEALSDMQKAQNSKRSIAEIALTKMCDTKLVISTEALALRVEQLEKQISLIKLGINANLPQTEIKIENEDVKHRQKTVKTSDNVLEDAKKFSRFQTVVERVSEIKRSLASQLSGAEIYVAGNNYIIKIGEFFAKRIAASEQDFTILKGVIAECVNLHQNDIVLTIEPIKPTGFLNASNELDNIFR